MEKSFMKWASGLELSKTFLLAFANILHTHLGDFGEAGGGDDIDRLCIIPHSPLVQLHHHILQAETLQLLTCWIV